MAAIKRTTSADDDFQRLVQLLDLELAGRDGDEHSFYAQYNKTGSLKHAVVYYATGEAAACGALRPYDANTVEIKRMYVVPHLRGQGIASIVLNELEAWAAKLGYKVGILETGKRQPEAIRLYEKAGYIPIPNYGQYAGVENSVCMRKEI